jgi:Uncharacterised nucleotidyltransferase
VSATTEIPGREWRLLERFACSVALGTADEFDFGDLKEIDWGELLEQALRHKLLPVFAAYVTLDRWRTAIPWPIRGHLDRSLALNRHAVDVHRGAAADAAQALEAAGVTFVATKGISFEALLYPGRTRYMNDLDFMTPPEDAAAFVAALAEIGFAVGDYHPPDDAILPPSRKELVTYRLNPDHSPLMTRLTGDPVVRAVRLDIAHTFTWARSDYEVPLLDAFAEAVPREVDGRTGVRLPVFSPRYETLFTILHLFREAWIDRWLTDYQDVNLAKFMDVLALWRIYGQELVANGWSMWLEKVGVTEPVAWVLEQLDAALGTSVTRQAGLQGKVSPEWLQSSYAPGGGLRSWSGSMRERLRSKERSELFVSRDGAR